MVAPGLEASSRPEHGWKVAKEVKDEVMAAARDGASLMQHMAHTAPKITKAGFQFLLRPVRAQVWQLLMDVVYRRRGKSTVKADELLTTVFELSFCSLGAGYSLDALSKSQQELMTLLGLLGLVYFRPNDPRRFYPTHLILDLVSNGQVSGSSDAKDASAAAAPKNTQPDAAAGDTRHGRCLIVETNYRIYAYTNSVLQEQVIRLFATMIYKLPHMLIAVITRSSVRNALVRGISAAQIIDYLHMHAHPQCMERGPVVPEVVSDQVCCPPIPGHQAAARLCVARDASRRVCVAHGGLAQASLANDLNNIF